MKTLRNRLLVKGTPVSNHPMAQSRLTCVVVLAAAAFSPHLMSAAASAVTAPHAMLQEVPFEKVHIADGFWAPRIEADQKVTIPDVLSIAEEQGKIDNLRIIAGRKKEGRIRHYNSPDSDIWKIMEAASYTLAWRRDPKLESQIDKLIELYASAQADDGYINQMFMLPRKSPVTAEHRKDLLGGVTVLLAKGLVEGEAPVKLTAVPYYAWQNRGIDEMTVWIVEAE